MLVISPKNEFLFYLDLAATPYKLWNLRRARGKFFCVVYESAPVNLNHY